MSNRIPSEKTVAATRTSSGTHQCMDVMCGAMIPAGTPFVDLDGVIYCVSCAPSRR